MLSRSGASDMECLSGPAAAGVPEPVVLQRPAAVRCSVGRSIRRDASDCCGGRGGLGLSHDRGTRSGGLTPRSAAVIHYLLCAGSRLQHRSYDVVNGGRNIPRIAPALPPATAAAAGSPARGAASQVQDQRPHAVPTRASRRSACRTAAGTDVNLEAAPCGVIEGQPCEFPCGQRGVHRRPGRRGRPQRPRGRIGVRAEASVHVIHPVRRRGGRRRPLRRRPTPAGRPALGRHLHDRQPRRHDRRRRPLRRARQRHRHERARRPAAGRRRRAGRGEHGAGGGLRATAAASLRIGVVTAHGVPTDTDLFTSGAGFLVVPEDGPDVAPASTSCAPAGARSTWRRRPAPPRRRRGGRPPSCSARADRG